VCIAKQNLIIAKKLAKLQNKKLEMLPKTLDFAKQT
jgi:hypothetical protein